MLQGVTLLKRAFPDRLDRLVKIDLLDGLTFKERKSADGLQIPRHDKSPVRVEMLQRPALIERLLPDGHKLTVHGILRVDHK